MDNQDSGVQSSDAGSPPGGRDKVKRGYRACLHCRSRKAKCDLGDIDAPSSPPCSRCKRESRPCVFAPSRRGGNNIRRKKDESELDQGPQHKHHGHGGKDQYDRGVPSRLDSGGQGSGGGTGGDIHAAAVGISGGSGSGTGRPAYSHVNSGQSLGRPPNVHHSQSQPSQPQSQPQPQRPSAPHHQHHHSGSAHHQDYAHADPAALNQLPTTARPGVQPSAPAPAPYIDPHLQRRFGNGAPLGDILQSPTHNPYALALGPSPATSHSPGGVGGNAHTPHGMSHHRHLPREHKTRERESSLSPKRRRLHLNPPLHAADPSSIVVADMQNEADALHILALASGKGGTREKKENRSRTSRSPSKAMSATAIARHKAKGMGAGKELKNFSLIRLGIVSEAQTVRLTDVFFRCHHHLYPMVPSAIIPRSPDQLAVFAHNERYLLAAIIIIASRNDQTMRDVHDRSWAVFRDWLSDIQCLGAPPTIGLVEGLLLLAENLPRDPARARKTDTDLHATGFGEEVHGSENRQAWTLIGAAIRNAYGLGLDKVALRLMDETSERTLEVERARLAWTYCYLFDRHVSLRLGLAFWSRGPTLCFRGFSNSAQTGPPAGASNFPFLREIHPESPGGEYPQEDLASLVQAYVELTQLMSNAHDCLYPNAARTRAIVLSGEYFKFIDELARSLEGFKILWRNKKWNIFPLTDALWAMFYYTQLYICAFSFQAHVERAAMRAEAEYNVLYEQHKAAGGPDDLPRPPLSLFPRGAAASPDARYIFQSCDAARTLLHICVNSLSPGGALPFLPSRYLLWFTYAAIVLLKALYSGAMLRADHAETLQLIDRLCGCLAAASPDEDHPAVRYGRQLESLSKKLAGQGDTTTGSPTGGHTVPLPPMHGAPRNGEASATHVPAIASSMPSMQQQQMPNYAQSPVWAFPPAPPEPQHLSFAYPSTPAPNQPYGPQSGHIPGSGMADTHPAEHPSHTGHVSGGSNIAGVGQNNLGFVQLDDWFGGGAVGGGGGTGTGAGAVGTGGADGGDDEANAGFGALDLQDFWMKVGPGEAQGGFPFR